MLRIVALALTVLSLQPASSFAAEQVDEVINYEPSFVYAQGAAGTTVTTSIAVRNQTRLDAAFTVQRADAAESPGASTAFDFLEIGEAPRGAGDWIRVEPKTFQLRAGTERRIPVRISIPADTGAGGHYGGVLFSVEPVKPAGQFDVSYSTGIPVLVTVDGAFERDLRVRVRADDRWRFSGGRTGWTVELRNEGDVHEVYSGRLRLDSMLSGSTSVALRPGILLPGERRTEHVRVAVRSAPDIYQARVRVQRDDARAVTASSSRMIVLPLWVLVVLAGVIAVVWYRLRTRRRHRQDEDGFDRAG